MGENVYDLPNLLIASKDRIILPWRAFSVRLTVYWSRWGSCLFSEAPLYPARDLDPTMASAFVPSIPQ